MEITCLSENYPIPKSEINQSFLDTEHLIHDTFIMQSKGWEFYLNPTEAWGAMYEDCDSATESIDCEQYSFISDAVGREFLKLFLKKAAEGVAVRVLCDMVGSFALYDAMDPERLKEAGVELRFYNPIAPWRLDSFTSWFFRDHRKLLVVDKKIAHTGGVGMNEVMRNWRDTSVRLTLPVVSEMVQSFNRMWEIAEKKKFLRFKKPAEIRNFSFSTNAPHRHQRFLYERLLSAAQTATHHVYLTTPYFIPNRALLRALRSAARRGIDVRLLVNKTSDHALVDRASESYFSSCLRAGIKLYQYQKSILHAKTAVIDARLAFVGSGNLDNLSLLFNNEADICSSDALFVRDVKQQFVNDLNFSRTIYWADWKHRPFSQKFMEFLTKPLHPVL